MHCCLQTTAQKNHPQFTNLLNCYMSYMNALLPPPPPSRPFTKARHFKTHSSGHLSVTKTLTPFVSSEVLLIQHWYLACMILVTSPFYWYHVVALTFDILQGKICCRMGDLNDWIAPIAYAGSWSRSHVSTFYKGRWHDLQRVTTIFVAQAKQSTTYSSVCLLLLLLPPHGFCGTLVISTWWPENYYFAMHMKFLSHRIMPNTCMHNIPAE